MDSIIELLETHGPLTGKELHEKSVIEPFKLWKRCNQSASIVTQTIGTQYLRLSKSVSGYARLSPSILREFYNYAVIGLKTQTKEIKAKAKQLEQSVNEISKAKKEIAKDIIKKIVDSQSERKAIIENACFMISGDVVYNMSHLEPRPESSTGKMVNGSDLDIVVIYKDLPEEIIEKLDMAIYEQKAFLLMNPGYREEIDYVIKNVLKVEKDLKFIDFNSMVASKILDEGKFLLGSALLFSEVKKMIDYSGVPGKLFSLKERALIERENAREILLAFDDADIDTETMHLFYTNEETEEFF